MRYLILLVVFFGSTLVNAEGMTLSQRTALEMRMDAAFHTMKQKHLPPRFTRHLLKTVKSKDQRKRMQKALASWPENFSRDVSYKRSGTTSAILYKGTPLVTFKVVALDPYTVEINSNTKVVLTKENLITGLLDGLKKEGFNLDPKKQSFFNPLLPRAWASDDDLKTTFLNSVIVGNGATHLTEDYSVRAVLTPKQFSAKLVEEGYLLPDERSDWSQYWNSRDDSFSCDGETAKGKILSSDGELYDFEANRTEGVTFKIGDYKVKGKIGELGDLPGCNSVLALPKAANATKPIDHVSKDTSHLKKFYEAHLAYNSKNDFERSQWMAEVNRFREEYPLEFEFFKSLRPNFKRPHLSTSVGYLSLSREARGKELVIHLTSACHQYSQLKSGVDFGCNKLDDPEVTIGDIKNACNKIKAGLIEAPGEDGFQICMDGDCEDTVLLNSATDLPGVKAALKKTKQAEQNYITMKEQLASKTQAFEQTYRSEIASGQIKENPSGPPRFTVVDPSYVDGKTVRAVNELAQFEKALHNTDLARKTPIVPSATERNTTLSHLSLGVMGLLDCCHDKVCKDDLVGSGVNLVPPEPSQKGKTVN